MTRALRAAAALLLAIAASARADLRPDELLLLTNRNDPASAALAAKYAAVRHVPAERVLALNVPAGEEIAPDVYDQTVFAPVHAYLATPAGKGIRCLVLFYGLPLRVSARPTSPADAAELIQLRALGAKLDPAADTLAADFDAIAKDAGIPSSAAPTVGVVADRVHMRGVEQALNAVLQKEADPVRREAVIQRVKAAQQASIAAAGHAMDDAMPSPSPRPNVSADAAKAAVVLRRDPTARATVRQYVSATAGVFALAEIVANQSQWLDNTESNASVDSDLALARFDDVPRARWQPNPLNYRAGAPQTPVLMTARIDAPTAEIAAKLIDDSIATEATGLDGRVVFDSRGLPAETNGKPDPYGWYDQAIRDTAALLKAKTKLDIVTDDREAVMPPHSVKGVALYCGWYSLRQYVPACGFVRGAVGYHVASFELVSLHSRFEKGWVANLLRDGVCATSGPVAEPYLASFPRPDDYFPLLLTGRLTLAEVYWKTCPMTSWMQTLIGDPLYRPYANHPAMAVDDLPLPLRAAVQKIEATQPSDR